MPSSPVFSAVVLAAGHSARMRRDKAVIEQDGIPLWRRQREVLAAAGATEIFLSARPDQAWTREAGREFSAVIHDALPGCGPMAGVTAGLERASHPWLAVLAIDLAQVTSGWYADLLAGTAPGVGMVGRRGEFYEPLAAIYPRELKWLAWEALVQNQYSMQQLVAAAVAQGIMRVREIRTEEAALFANWNTPADLTRVPGGPSSAGPSA